MLVEEKNSCFDREKHAAFVRTGDQINQRKAPRYYCDIMALSAGTENVTVVPGCHSKDYIW